MAVFTIDWDDPIAPECRGGAVSIGNFDGVHKGHQEILTENKRQAHAVSGPALAVTFDPHPLQLLRPDDHPPLLTTMPSRSELLQETGIDYVVILRTSPTLLQLSASDFFQRVILDNLHAKRLVEGASFGFGRRREGNIDTLRDLCCRSGLVLTVVPPLHLDGETISSSQVRALLTEGDVRKASELLGRPYRIAGTVGMGQQRGRGIGFPTANLDGVTTLLPSDGVYAVRVAHDGREWPGAANIGANPTFGEKARKIEVHIIGFEGDLYSRKLDVDFIDRLRDTRPFGGVDELVAQLKRDVEAAKGIFRQGS